MTRLRIGFLPLFFVCLGLVFAGALYFRMSTHSNLDGAGLGGSLEPGRSAAPPAFADPSETTGTLVPVREEKDPARFPSPHITEPAPAPSDSAGASPSFLSRLVQPIVSAVTGAGRAQEGPVAARPAAAPPQTSPAQPPSRAPGESPVAESAGDRKKAGEDDPTSDSAAPRLVSAEFTPAEVQDGQETILAVQAVDELSGVRTISGTIAAPSGAIQGFACQREGETDRWSARIRIPRDAAEGKWWVSYLSLTDKASNSATLDARILPPSASFRVISSRPDSQGPTLKAIWTDRQSIKAGEKSTIFAQAEDDKSGVNLISGVFRSPSGQARVGFVCRPGTDQWSCDFTAPACASCGSWQLEQVQLQDKASNSTILRQDNSMVQAMKVEITSDRCDSIAPALEAIVLDQTVVSNVEESVITVTATVSEEVCGVMNVSGQASGPETSGATGPPPRLYFAFTQAGDSRTWTGRVVVPRLAAKGMWRISWVQVLDKGHNLRTYSPRDPVLLGAVFNVQ